MSDLCQTCRYYAYDFKQCRRQPPTSGAWPHVEPDDWCGEYQPRTWRQRIDAGDVETR